jgi:hypothetical protein
MRTTKALVVGDSDRPAVANHDGAYQRVRLDRASPSLGLGQRNPHPTDVVFHR